MPRRRRRWFRYILPEMNTDIATKGPIDNHGQARPPFKWRRRRRRRAKAGCPLTVLTLALAAALVYVAARTI